MGTIIAITLGWAGGYRFYRKQYGLGVLYLFTFGLFGIGWFVDIFASLKEKAVTSVSSKVSQRLSDDYYYFDDHYYRKCEEWEAKIDEVDVSSDNPDKNISAYKKKIQLAEQFKAFCDGKRGGAEYFAKEYPSFISDIQNELDQYLKEDYPQEKRDYEENLNYQKLTTSTKGRIVSLLKDGPVLQTQLKDNLSGESQTVFEHCINELMSENKIVKSHEGKRVVYSLSNKTTA